MIQNEPLDLQTTIYWVGLPIDEKIYGINNRLEIEEEKASNLEDIAIETTQIKHREPLLLLFLNDKVIVSYGATSRGLTYV